MLPHKIHVFKRNPIVNQFSLQPHNMHPKNTLPQGINKSLIGNVFRWRAKNKCSNANSHPKLHGHCGCVYVHLCTIAVQWNFSR